MEGRSVARRRRSSLQDTSDSVRLDVVECVQRFAESTRLSARGFD